MQPSAHTTAAPYLGPGETVVLYDGVCKLCNAWVRFIIAHDRHRRIRLAPVQSEQGQALLAWAGLPLQHFNTIALICDNRVALRSQAFFEVMARLPWPWRGLGVLKVCPRPVRDWLYDRIALNRYRLFGRYPHCVLPTADHDRRFLSGGR
jgi:predicted DCC family thiol-disulfide oxidoreductase YuxK